jgi:hypothetical protein
MSTASDRTYGFYKCLLMFLILTSSVFIYNSSSIAQSRSSNVGESLYNLKMRANAACGKARRYARKMRKVQAAYRQGRITRSEYRADYALFLSKKHVCLQAKRVYTMLKNARSYSSDSQYNRNAGNTGSRRGSTSAQPSHRSSNSGYNSSGGGNQRGSSSSGGGRRGGSGSSGGGGSNCSGLDMLGQCNNKPVERRVYP